MLAAYANFNVALWLGLGEGVKELAGSIDMLVKVDVPEPMVDMCVGSQTVDVGAGGDHSVCLGISGAVYTFGSGAQGQLGHGRDWLKGSIDVWNPTRVIKP